MTEATKNKVVATKKKAANATNERVINGVKISDESKCEYVDNPKRQNSAAGKRYAIYQVAKTVGEYFKLFDENDSLNRKFALPDLRHDTAKGFVSFE